MSDIKGKYKKILEDLENNIKEPYDLTYSKEKITELTFIFMDIVDRLTALMDERIKEVEDRQLAINHRIEEVQSLVDEIEGDIYEQDDNYEFEIICPYCNYEFTTDIEDEEKDETAVFPCGCGRVYDGGSHLAAAGNFGVFYRSRECLESYGVRT